MRIRFTIPSLLYFILVVALGIGWWADHRRMESHLKEMSDGFWEEEQANLREHEFRANRVDKLLDSAQKSAPIPEVSAEIIDTVRHDPDWSIRVHAMAVLPYLNEREKAIDALIEATTVRDDNSSGGGNVPLYAARYLAEMKATRGINAVADWIAFIKQQQPYSDHQREIVLKQSEKHLADLKAAE